MNFHLNLCVVHLSRHSMNMLQLERNFTIAIFFNFNTPFRKETSKLNFESNRFRPKGLKAIIFPCDSVTILSAL